MSIKFIFNSILSKQFIFETIFLLFLLVIFDPIWFTHPWAQYHLFVWTNWDQDSDQFKNHRGSFRFLLPCSWWQIHSHWQRRDDFWDILVSSKHIGPWTRIGPNTLDYPCVSVCQLFWWLCISIPIIAFKWIIILWLNWICGIKIPGKAKGNCE